MAGYVKILVAEDDELLWKPMDRYLRRNGFEAEIVKDGKTAIKRARKTKPQLILLDWAMPDMEGIDVLTELKHHRKTRNIPVFMLTGKDLMGDIEKAYEVGADDYIIKPIDYADIGMIVKDKWTRFKEKSSTLQTSST